MRVFFDTSVLVAALFEGHPFHRQAFPWLKRAREREFSFLVATHTLAELYSALIDLQTLAGRGRLEILSSETEPQASSA
jgi:predicted nucleic acid-binding protein